MILYSWKYGHFKNNNSDKIYTKYVNANGTGKCENFSEIRHF